MSPIPRAHRGAVPPGYPLASCILAELASVSPKTIGVAGSSFCRSTAAALQVLHVEEWTVAKVTSPENWREPVRATEGSIPSSSANLDSLLDKAVM